MKIILKKKVTVILSSALLALGISSCKTDLLDPVPETVFSDLVVFNTPARIALQVNGLYTYVKAGAFYAGRYQVYNDIRIDDFIAQTTNNVTGYSVWNHTLNESNINDVTNLWNAAYAAINQANVFLAGMDANQANFVAPTFPTNFATTTANNYRGEARFLRALSYYALLQLYARPYADGEGNKPGLPLRLIAETNSNNNDLARSSVAEVYDQILADLQFAEDNLPLTYSSSELNVTRAHRNTAIALKTRVLLTMGRYKEVITEANKIVPATAPYVASSGVANALNASVKEVFTFPELTSESIFSFPFTTQNAPGTQNSLAFYYLPGSLGGNGEYSLNTAGILGNSVWEATDERRINFVTRVANTPYLTKYPNGTLPGNTNPNLDKAPVIRYAEVMLNLAEAEARVNGFGSARALALLNAVRTRSKGSPYTVATVENILLERRIEFIGEGIRNIDIMRLNATIPGKSSVSAVAPSDPLYVWPIPAGELQANQLMTRN
ncbi:RagB/SusD family nutrient uptake outer membrane protein [Hymenobacter defluvii]|uniref:RagB/SusD family nutrient uptake outer membrane protein n=1 Tax=Hymenobacter defluvii TaxID=2054411 RepID=A0ABS3TDE0_9BACT|nr:RagB/SusD family nutrient uptake outer membrane protein [Hymenobacter defluvii]MBO3271373.1 RagB/SusD family nutrient uptake outer membrane protein [Hymenobacter defluvii]